MGKQGMSVQLMIESGSEKLCLVRLIVEDIAEKPVDEVSMGALLKV